MGKVIVLLLFVWIAVSPAFGQGRAEGDTVNIDNPAPTAATPAKKRFFFLKDDVHNPNKASLYSAVLPGLGQAYNGKYWKIPLIYSGLSVMAFYIKFNHNQYITFRTLLFAELDSDPTTVNNTALDVDGLRRNTDNWRRNRDLLIVLTGVVYVLNIVDAHIDAHFKTFDLDKDLTLKLEPSFESLPISTMPAAGLSLTLKF